MPPRTILPNKYEKYFIIIPYEWHQNKIGYYHVSQIGSNQQSREQKEHSGPCLRNTFYGFIPIDIKKETLSKTGNFFVGKLFHKEGEETGKINDPFYFPEFPLQKILESKGKKIILLGSVDMPKQVQLTLADNPKDPIVINILDFKTASDYTFPYDNSEKNKNPTNFDQVRIYTYWMANYYFNKKYVTFEELTVAYINKHEAYVGEQSEKYNNDKAMGIFVDFVSRAFELNDKLLRFMEIYNGYVKYIKDYPIPKDEEIEKLKFQMNGCLPRREPHKWCKFCENRFRCRDDVIFDCDVRRYSQEEIQVFYKNETGKSHIWRGKQTKAYEKFAYGFKIEGDEL